MGNFFFTPSFSWGRFLLVALPILIAAAFLGRWAAYGFFHGSLTSVFLIKFLLDAGVLTQKKVRGKSPLKKVK